jgi:hypothetical protein
MLELVHIARLARSKESTSGVLRRLPREGADRLPSARRDVPDRAGIGAQALGEAASQSASTPHSADYLVDALVQAARDPIDRTGSSLQMAAMNNQIMRRSGLLLVVLTSLLALTDTGGQAAGYSPGCGHVPIVYGIPPWGFHTGAPITGPTGSFARGHGEINLEAHTVSGILCQEDHVRDQPTRAITMTVEHHLLYQSHYAVMWGVPGNIMKIRVRVRASNDPDCEVGTIGRAILFASYNGVRSDSVQFKFPASCESQDHLYHGTQVNNQVPPL